MSRGFSLADARPAFAETQEQLTALGQSQESQSFVNTIGSAFSLSTLSDAQQLNSPVAMLIRQAQRDMFDRDPNYKLTEDRLIQLTQDVDPVYWDMFEEADSEDRANMIRSQALDLTATRRRLGEQGFGGVVASIGTSIADPLALAAGYLTAGMSYGGVAAEAGVVGARAARLTRLARAGAINATPQMVIDAYTASQSPDFNAGDVIAGAAGAFTFGGYLAARGFADFQAVQAGRKMANGWRVAGEGALAQALPTTIVDAIANDRTTTETLGAFFLNMAVGGTFATTARTSELGRAVEDYSKKALKDIDQRALFEEGMTATYTPPAPSKEVQDALAGAMPFVSTPIRRGQSATKPITHDDLKPGMTVRLYRGEGAGVMGESVGGGDWWTTDIRLARQYGNVTAVDIDALELGKISAKGADGNTTWVVQGGLDKLKSVGGSVVPVAMPDVPRKGGLPTVSQPTADGFPVPPIVAFATAKGSTYEVSGNRTTRNKAARPEHPGEAGMQPTSERTVYVADGDIDKLSPFQTTGTGRKFVSFDDNAKTVAITSVDENGKRGIWRDSVVSYSETPGVGLYPVEVWDGGASAHFGNKIVSVQQAPPISVPAKGGLPVINRPTAAERTIRESILTDQITTGESPSIAPRPKERVGQANLRDDYQMGDLSLHQVDETPDENLAVKFAPFANVQQNGTPLEVFVAKAIRFDPSGDNASGGSAATWAEMRAKGAVNEWHSQYDREFRSYNENARKSGTPEVSAQAFDAMVHQAMLLAIDNPAALRTNVGEGPSGWVQDGTPVQLEGVQGPRVRQQSAPIGTIDEQPAFRYDSRPQDRGVIASNEVRRAAKLVFDLNKRTGEVMNRHGIDNPVNTKENYFPIIWDANKIKTAMLQPGGERKLEQAFATAYERLMDRSDLETLFPTLEVQDRLAARAEVARLVAKQVILNGGTRNDIDVATQHSLLTADQYNTIEAVIKDKFPNADARAIREVLFALKPMDEEKAAASFLQSRIPLDYTYRVKFEDGSSMAVGDFLSDSVTDITRHYTRRAYGAAATAELGRVLQETYGLPAAPKTADAILSLVRQQQKATGNEDAGRLLDLEFLLKITNGIPLERPTLFGAGENATLYQSSLRAFRASIRTALLGTVNAAIGQAQEFAGVIGQNGVTAFSRSMPWAWDLRKKLLAGEKLPPGLMRLAVEHGFASGVFGDRVVSGHVLEDNQLAANGASRKQRVARVLDKASAYMNRFSGLTSGESFIRNIQEAGVVYSTAESLARVATGEKSMNIADAELARWGVTRSEYDHILGQLKKYGKDTDAGYHEPNVDKWQDALGQPDISGMAAYERLIDNASRIALQMGETTLLPKSWHTTEGKVFTQLMPYAYSSFYYRLLPLMTNKPNMRSAQMFFASLLSGALGVLALTYMQSINRDDREEFLKERLDPKRFTMMTFGRSSFSSLLPRFVDAAFAASGEAPPFAGSRLSGLGQDSGALGVLAGFPAIDRLKSIIGATRGVVRAPLDSEYDFSQRDVRNVIRALGLPNYPGTHQFIMQLGDLPERPN